MGPGSVVTDTIPDKGRVLCTADSGTDIDPLRIFVDVVVGRDG